MPALHAQQPPSFFNALPQVLNAAAEAGKKAIDSAVSASAALDPSGGSGERISAEGDPIAMSNGEFVFAEPLVNLGGPIPVAIHLSYGSQATEKRLPDGLPSKFTHTLRQTLLLTQPGGGLPDTIEVEFSAGRILKFTETGPGQWTVAAFERWQYQLREHGDFFFLHDPESDLFHLFRQDAAPPQFGVTRFFLAQIRDRSGNALTFTNPAEVAETGPVQVSDGRGRTLTLTYAPVGGVKHLASIADHTGRTWTLGYEENPADNPGLATLRSITDPLGGVTLFRYGGNHRVTAIRRPRGNTPYTQTYAPGGDPNLGVVATQTDARGQVFTLSQVEADRSLGDTEFVFENPDGTRRRFFHRKEGKQRSAEVDEEENVFTFHNPSDRQQLETIFDAGGNRLDLRYHAPSGHLLSVRDRSGRTTTFAYQATAVSVPNPDTAGSVTFDCHDLTQIAHGDGTTTRFTYTGSSGLPATITDRTGATTTFTYTPDGLPATVTNPTGGVETRTHHPSGRLASLTDSDTGVTTFTYDALHRLIRVTHPDATFREFTYDALDRTLTFIDERGIVLVKNAYDANGNLTSQTQAVGEPEQRTTAIAYDDLDFPVTLTDPAGHTVRFEYTYFNELSRVVLEDGSDQRYDYDARRRLARVTDEGGRVLALERDPTGMLLAATTPLGRRTAAGRDAAGRVTAATDPSGGHTAIARDADGRPTRLTDPLGRFAAFDRDAEGRPLARRQPVIGELRHARSALGLLTALRDARGHDWRLGRTAMGRLASHTDPLDRQWTFSRDARGRLETVVHPDGVTETRTHDPAGRVVRINWSDGLVHTFAYDALGQLVEAAASNGAAVAVTHDPRGLPLATTVNGFTVTAAYDARGRLASLDYGGLMTVTYAYDVHGKLASVSDSLTAAAMQWTYNADLQPVRLARSNGADTTFTHDAGGRLTRIDHGPRGSLDLAYDAAGEITASRETGMPLDRAAAVTAATAAFTHDAANQVAGFTYDARGRTTGDGRRAFAWDSAGHLVSVVQGATAIQFTYTPLGQPASRDDGATTTRFACSYALPNAPVLAELAGGAPVRFHVFHPDGRLAYQVEFAPAPVARFPHFDQIGNTLFRTGPGGVVTDAYACDRFGVLLAQTGASDQPHRFHGEHGVRSDPGSGLVQMGFRHYDPATARFLSRDPIFLRLLTASAADANPYHFVAANPVQNYDPTGLAKLSTERQRELLQEFKLKLFSAGIRGGFLSALLSLNNKDFGNRADTILGGDSGTLKMALNDFLAAQGLNREAFDPGLIDNFFGPDVERLQGGSLAHDTPLPSGVDASSEPRPVETTKVKVNKPVPGDERARRRAALRAAARELEASNNLVNGIDPLESRNVLNFRGARRDAVRRGEALQQLADGNDFEAARQLEESNNFVDEIDPLNNRDILNFRK